MSEKTDAQQVQLQPNMLQLQDYVSSSFDAVIATGVNPEQILVPAFWAHHAVKMKPMDEIRARSEDGTWVAYLIVTDCSRTWARVHQRSIHRLTTAQVAETQASEAEVEAVKASHKVSHTQESKWRVVRNGDRVVVQDRLGTRDAAEAWLDTFARQQIGAPARAPAAVTA